MRVLSIIIFFVFFLNCTRESNVAGGSSTVDNPKVMATIVTGEGSPATGITVRVRSQDYTAESTGLRKSTIMRIDAVTDDKGRLLLDEIEPGFYNIEVTNGIDAGVLLPCTISAEEPMVNLGTVRLEKFFKVKAISTLLIGHTKGVARVVGLERFESINPLDGSFEFNDLPAGTYTIQIFPEGLSASFIEWTGIKGNAGGTYTRYYSSSQTSSHEGIYYTEGSLGGKLF